MPLSILLRCQSQWCSGRAGFSKFIIQRIEIEEPRSGGGTSRRSSSGCPGQGGADRERRAIVSAWNPDESWDDDPAVRHCMAPPPGPRACKNKYLCHYINVQSKNLR